MENERVAELAARVEQLEAAHMERGEVIGKLAVALERLVKGYAATQENFRRHEDILQGHNTMVGQIGALQSAHQRILEAVAKKAGIDISEPPKTPEVN